MSAYFNLLDEQTRLLKSKGYDENGLNSPDSPGKMIQSLKGYMSKAVSDALMASTPAEFSIQTTGFFNDNRDIVHFDFHYKFDVENIALNIERIRITQDDHVKEIYLRSNQDLPSAKEVLNLLQCEIQQNNQVDQQNMKRRGRKL